MGVPSQGSFLVLLVQKKDTGHPSVTILNRLALAQHHHLTNNRGLECKRLIFVS